MASIPSPQDPTLAAVDAALVDAAIAAPARAYLGASGVGHDCPRALWYAFRWAREARLSAKALKAIEDGHQGEALMAQRLRTVPGIQLWTGTDAQYGFQDLNGHFRGHVDGVIQGVLQAPKTPHVWEHKQVNDKKFAKLVALVQKDEKSALEQWDRVYFVQAQLYMHYLELTRHYLTCSTPGGREQTSCRTDYQKEVALWAIQRAQAIITDPRLPSRLSDHPDFWECRYCDYSPICHGREIAAIHCRSCAHSTAQLDGAPWRCEWHRRELSPSEQRQGCPDHLIHPDLLAHHAEIIDGDPDAGTVTYRMHETGTHFKNGHRPSPDANVYSSHEIRVAASGCQDGYAALDWAEALANEKGLAAIRTALDAEIVKVTL